MQNDVDIKVARPEELTADVKKIITTYSKEIFDDKRDHPWADFEFEWAAPSWRVMAFCQETLASQLAITECHGKVGKTPVFLAGIGNVMTPEQWRGKGLAGVVMKKAAEFMKTEIHCDFGLLFCNEKLVPLYQKLGWIPVKNKVVFSLSSGQKSWQEETMYLPCMKQVWPEKGILDLCGKPF